eukprot:TRINITY_DN5499_c0_g1_i2.p1 TRINITY_DN5499_c0_g1~~TRINITY_DN5499_c0_g1_i2.p1  ORF type:complete len:431 (+),score=65.47 TRINITY_DN5499_c0_g1_i2:80-1372(+)
MASTAAIEPDIQSKTSVPPPGGFLPFSIDSSTLLTTTSTKLPLNKYTHISERFMESLNASSQVKFTLYGSGQVREAQPKKMVEKLEEYFERGQKNEEKETTPEKNEESSDENPLLEKQLEDEIRMEAGHRYFASKSVQIICRRCKQQGHIERMCPVEREKTCFYCLGFHREEKCDQLLCFKCNQSGHMSRDCPFARSARCYRCGSHGHRQFDCNVLHVRAEASAIASDENLRFARCLSCNKAGHLNCANFDQDVDQIYGKRSSRSSKSRDKRSFEGLRESKDFQKFSRREKFDNIMKIEPEKGYESDTSSEDDESFDSIQALHNLVKAGKRHNHLEMAEFDTEGAYTPKSKNGKQSKLQITPKHPRSKAIFKTQKDKKGKGNQKAKSSRNFIHSSKEYNHKGRAKHQPERGFRQGNQSKARKFLKRERQF